MSAALGAALKKIAVALLSDKRTWKVIGAVVLGLILLIIFPLSVLATLNTGAGLKLDSDALRKSFLENMSMENKAVLQAMEDGMLTIEKRMIEAGFPARVKEAQILYFCCLYEIEKDDPRFYEKLVGCFAADQTDEQLISAVNRTFGVNISVKDFRNIMSLVKNTYIDASKFRNPALKNNLDLVEWAKNAYDSGWGYVWGTYGLVLTEDLLNVKINQYPDMVGGKADYIRKTWLKGRTADCVGLIKGYGWFDPATQQINYGSNGMRDVTATGMYNAATVKGPISTIPETPGLAVWMPGHIGIYIGGGEVIEAQSTRNGVKKTKLAGRGWHAWLEVPYINYTAVPGEENL